MLLHTDHELLPVDLPRAGYRQICAVGVVPEEVFLAEDTKLSGAFEERLDDLLAIKDKGCRIGGCEAGYSEVEPLVWCNEFAPLEAPGTIEFVGLVDIELAGGWPESPPRPCRGPPSDPDLPQQVLRTWQLP